MQQINPPKTPAWRDPARLRAQARERKLRPILAALSLVVLALMAVPTAGGYDEAISFQLARGEWVAWSLFTAIGFTLVYVSARLWGWESKAWAFASVLVVSGLGVIAFTNPLSANHNAVFITLSLCMVVGQAFFLRDHLDPWLVPPALLSVVGLCLCIGHLGLGERLLIGSSLASINVLVYGHLDP